MKPVPGQEVSLVPQSVLLVAVPGTGPLQPQQPGESDPGPCTLPSRMYSSQQTEHCAGGEDYYNNWEGRLEGRNRWS